MTFELVKEAFLRIHGLLRERFYSPMLQCEKIVHKNVRRDGSCLTC